MELDIAHSYGWLQNDVTIAMSMDELQQLRFAVSVAQAHVQQPIFDDFLDMTDECL